MILLFFFFQAEDGIRDLIVTGVQTCALPIYGRRYATAKDSMSALDFDDLELRARDLLRDAAPLRAAVRERFAHLMVDEFQDTNPLQNELLDLVSDGNLFTVGDEHQSIYGFRNADVSVFRERRDAA